MGFYIVPDYASTIEDVVTAIRRRPCGDDLLVARDFNMKFADSKGTTRAEEIASDLYAAELEVSTWWQEQERLDL